MREVATELTGHGNEWEPCLCLGEQQLLSSGRDNLLLATESRIFDMIFPDTETLCRTYIAHIWAKRPTYHQLTIPSCQSHPEPQGRDSNSNETLQLEKSHSTFNINGLPMNFTSHLDFLKLLIIIFLEICHQHSSLQVHFMHKMKCGLIPHY